MSSRPFNTIDINDDTSCAYGGFLLVMHTIARGVIRPTYSRPAL